MTRELEWATSPRWRSTTRRRRRRSNLDDWRRSAVVPDAAATARIEKGRQLFTQVGCASCHIPEMHLAKTVFEEPNLGGGAQLHRPLPGQQGISTTTPKRPVDVDLLKDAVSHGSKLPRPAARPSVCMAISNARRHGQAVGRSLAIAPLDSQLAQVQDRRNGRSDSAVRIPQPELCRRRHRAAALTIGRARSPKRWFWHGEDSPPPSARQGGADRSRATGSTGSRAIRRRWWRS